MFFLPFESIAAAFQHVRENLSDLNGRPEANETDLVFLQGILANPAVTQLIKWRRFITPVLTRSIKSVLSSV
ncbi:AGAP008323-PA-like protein [Anopheles sinensis]|uniref:AGAP008323-PA-like protein n=1 Tax=Anopheles sinensis TaxID=74873 RepID=A0A084VEB6_ANOSI|nr:AGAP008323-PA-like protein [Anopheles sinensis]